MRFNTYTSSVLKSRTRRITMELSIRFLAAVIRGIVVCVAPFKNAGKELCFYVAFFLCRFIRQRRLHIACTCIVIINCIGVTRQWMMLLNKKITISTQRFIYACDYATQIYSNYSEIINNATYSHLTFWN